MKTTYFLPILALALRVAALPPACLLHAVNTAEDPADISAICGSDATDIQQAIFDMCEEHYDTAQTAFVDTCGAAGTSVAAFTPTTTRAPSATGTGSGTYVYTTASYNSDCDCTQTSVVTATGVEAESTGLVTGTATGAGASETGAADRMQMGSFAAAVVAVAGVVAVL